jgi:serine/threonine protein kinase
MTRKRWERICAVFDEAVACEPQKRSQLLDEACGGDAALRAEVEALLANDRGDEFLEPIGGTGRAPTDGAADPFVGHRVGHYEIKRRIGQGGMGNVYLGVRTEDYTTQVAIKLIRRGMDSEIMLDRFKNEMQFQAELGKHPNIAKLLDAGETGPASGHPGLPYYVMEYVEGERIDRWCDHHRLPLRRRLELFRDVCGAVQFAHQNTVIHRDLKPGNILVTEDGRPMLIDFGIAKLLDTADAAAKATLTGMQVLTPDYASPEQVRGERLTTASDVYSLGVVLYELLTGRRPYRVDAQTPLELARIVSDVAPVRPSDAVARQDTAGQVDVDTVTPEEVAQARDTHPGRLSRALRGDLDRIVLMALRKEPDRRYGSAEQLAADVDRYLQGLPVRAQRDTWAYRARKFAARNWAALAAAALVLVAIIGGAAFSFTQWRRAEDEASHARLAAIDEAVAKQTAINAQAEAEREAAKAEAALDFLVEDIISAAHPGELGYKATVLEAVEGSLAKIDTRFAGQPESAAAVHLMAGSVLKSFGRLQEALAQYQLGFDLRRRYLGPTHRDTLEAQWGVAMAYGALAQRDRSIPLLREALARCRDQFGENDVLTVGIMEGLGEELQAYGEFAEGERVLRDAMRLQDSVYPPGDQRRAYAASSLIGLYIAQNKFEQAEEIAREHIAFAKRHLKRDHTIHVSAHIQLANALYSQKRYIEAKELLDGVIFDLDDLMPNDDWRRGVLCTLYGLSLWRIGQLDEAEPYMLKQYEIVRNGRGADDWMTERALSQLRNFMYDRGKIVEGLAYHMEKLRTRLRIGGRDQGESILAAFREYADAANKYDRYNGDDALFVSLVEYGQNELPMDHPHRAQYLGNLGWALLQKERYEQAEPLLLASYDERKVSQGMDHGDVHWLLAALIDLYSKTEQAEEVAQYRHVLDAVRQK